MALSSFNIVRHIDAPIERVFAVFTEFEKAGSRIAAIERLDILTDGPLGVGTRLRETRIAGGRRVVAELEVIRFEPGEGYATVCETGGCRFTSACLMWKDGEGAKVEVALECEPHSFPARIKLKLLAGAIRREFERDLDALQRAAESDG